MKNLKHLLAAIAGLTLVLSVMSSVSAVSFAGLNAYAQDHNNNSSPSGNDNSDDGERDDHGNQAKMHYNEQDDESKGVEINTELTGLNVTGGAYNVTFSCAEPQINKTLDSQFIVKNGTGKIEAKIALDNGTYSGCELVIGANNIALISFDSFTIPEHSENDNHDEGQKHRHDIVSRENGTEIHERHIKANPSSPGDYKPGLNFTLTAHGTAVNASSSTHSANATINANMSVWKSNPAIVLLDLTGGTVQVGAQKYNIEIGYALYSPHFGAFRIGALVSDNSGNILRLVMRGNTTENTGLPTQAGKSINMSFEGDNGQSSSLEGWALTLEGAVKAG